MIRQLWRFLMQRRWILVKNASKSRRMNSVKLFKQSMKQLYKRNIKSKKSSCWRLLQCRKRTKSYSQSYSECNLTRIIWILRRMLILYLCATMANKHRQWREEIHHEVLKLSRIVWSILTIWDQAAMASLWILTNSSVKQWINLINTITAAMQVRSQVIAQAKLLEFLSARVWVLIQNIVISKWHSRLNSKTAT